MTSLKLSSGLSLNLLSLNHPLNESVKKELKTNHIIVIDVSGSMSYELSNIRKQLKNKLPDITKAGDTISIVWFSGSTQCGVLKENLEIKSLKDFTSLNDSIDKWLTPIGATAFAPPLVMVKKIIDNIRKTSDDGVFNLFFMTDGYNNDSSWSSVIDSLKILESEVSTSTFVEYGNYADSKKISEMAEILGGEKIEASNFNEYAPIFENNLTKKFTSTKKRLETIPDGNKYNFVFTITDNNEVIAFSVNNNRVLVGSDIKELYFFSESPIGI